MNVARPEPAKIAAVSVFLCLVLYTLILTYQGVSLDQLLGSAKRVGTVVTVVGGFWWFYNKHGWALPSLRFGGWLSAAPDLRGRWEGTVCRSAGDSPHKFVVEISQSYSSISFRTFSENSRGQSIATVLNTDEHNSAFTLVSLWLTDTQRINDPAARDTFYGASVWSISGDQSQNRIDLQIEDSYFTGRDPPTKGKVSLRWISKKLTNRFE